jgi:hypothetical protein
MKPRSASAGKPRRHDESGEGPNRRNWWPIAASTRERDWCITAARNLPAAARRCVRSPGGLNSASGAYKQLARLKRAGLAEVQRADLGYLLGERPLGLWKITEQGQRALDGAGLDRLCEHAGRRSHMVCRARPQVNPRDRNPTSLVAAYRLLALLVAERAANGQSVDVGTWERPWVRDVWSPQLSKLLCVRLPAGGCSYLGGQLRTKRWSTANGCPCCLFPTWAQRRWPAIERRCDGWSSSAKRG